MKRLFALFLIFGAGAALSFVLLISRPAAPLRATLAPFFQLAGQATKTADGMLARVMPIDAVDEREFGEILARKIRTAVAENDPDSVYLNELMAQLAGAAKKPFRYRVIVLPSTMPNAFALPGGTVIVTRGLLMTLSSESEVIAVLSHEMGHIELGHCFNDVKFEILARKVRMEPLGKLADTALDILVHHSFSKTQENEADEYSFELLCSSPYDPAAEGKTFAVLRSFVSQDPSYRKREAQVDFIRDYISSHPPLILREKKYAEKAKIWWEKHSREKRYVGISNLSSRLAYPKSSSDPAEWVSSF